MTYCIYISVNHDNDLAISHITHRNEVISRVTHIQKAIFPVFPINSGIRMMNTYVCNVTIYIYMQCICIHTHEKQ